MTGTADLLNAIDPKYLYRVLALFIAIPIHEFAHALAARWAGDHTAESMGRVSLDPFKHLDILGSILIIVGGFGWGKPVPVNPYNFRHPRWGSLVVSAAGPGANVLLAIGIGVLGIQSGLVGSVGEGYVAVAEYLVLINLALALFNLLPVPPLDGSKILLAVLPTQPAIQIAKFFDQYGMLLLLVLLISNTVDAVIGPAVRFLYPTLVGW